MMISRFVVQGVLMVSAFLLSVVPARAEIAISYLGPAEAHLRYSHNATTGGDLGVKLVAVKTDGSETKLDPADAAYGPLGFSGTRRHADLDRNGGYRYELRVVYQLPGEAVKERTVETSSISLNDTIWGTLLFDETINAGALGIDPLTSRGVTVPAGTTLTFEGPATLNGSSITVEGQIALSALCNAKAIWITLKSAHTFQELNMVNLAFATAAAGSSIAKGSDLTLSHTGGDLLIQNIRNLVITQLPWEGGTLTLENVKPWLVDNMPGPNQAPYLGAGTTFHLKNVDVLLPKDYAYTTFYFHPHGSGTYLFEDCLFDTRISFSVEGQKPNNITFRRSKFKLGIGVIGGAPVFEECEFGGDVALYNRTAAIFRKNAFWGTISFTNNIYNPGIAWNAAGTDLPTIDQNSFYGLYALFYPDKCATSVPKVPTPIPIGSGNYFGDDQGFVPLADPCTGSNALPDRFLTKRGALVVDKAITGPVFDIAGSASSPTLVQKDNRVLPSFWLINSIIGQNTIPHVSTLPASPLLQGKETLICLELATNDNRGVSGLKVYAKVDGTVVQTTPMPPVRRDVSSYANKGGNAMAGSSSIANGMATLNFVLPPVNKASATVEIYLDASAITGYDTNGDGVDDPGPTYQPRLLTKTLNFAPPYGRTLNVLFHTVQIVRGPFDDPWNTKSNALTRTRNALASFMPAMFPIRAEDLSLYHLDEQRVISTASTATGLLNDLSPIVELVRQLYEQKKGVKIDFQVAVLPANSLGPDIAGANFSSRRQILFVDEDKLTAILHEMGHGLGMYRQEQYDQFTPDGLFVENVTAFVNAPRASISWMSGGRRVQHIVASDHPHYTNQDWMDLMSRSDYPVWPIPSTLASFYSALRGLLGTGSAGTQGQSIRSAAGSAVPLSGDATRVLVLGTTKRTTEGGVDLYKLQAGTIRALAIDSSMLPSLPAHAAGPGDAYRLETFDGAGGSLSSQQFYVTKTNPYNGDIPPDTDIWYATFDLPAGSVRYTITRVADTQRVFEVGPGGELSCSLIEPATGAALGERVQVRWNVTPSAPVNAGQPIQSMAFLSPDGGATWQPATLFHETKSLDISTESLPSGSGTGLRIISSDGLRSCTMQASGLAVGNRPPAVRINSPREGDAAPADFAWMLSAEALDVESGQIDTGVWQSSIDGQLGTSPVVEGVRLSAGMHTLTYRAQDAANAVSTAQVHVTAGDAVGVDLFFAPDALRVTPPGTDPVYKPTVTVLKTGALHSAALKIRNGGIAAKCDLKLYLQDPSASETLIASHNGVSLEPFADFILPASFTPGAAGAYRFRAVVGNSIPEEVNTGNNERTWTLYTEPTKITLAPLSNGSWSAQSAMTISWTFSGYLGNTVSIELLESGVAIRTLDSAHTIGSGGTGTFSWSIPRNVPVGANYRIRVTSLGDPSVNAVSSGAFEILPPEPTLPDAISVLKIMTGLPVSADAMTALRDIKANGRIGLPEVIFMLQKAAGMR